MNEQRFKVGDRIRTNDDYTQQFDESFSGGTILAVRGTANGPIFYDYKVRLDGITGYFGHFHDDEVEAIDEYKFKVGDRVISNAKYAENNVNNRPESGVVTEVYEGEDAFRNAFPITVAIDEEDGIEGLFAEDELELL